jgi:hypothetical protein
MDSVWRTGANAATLLILESDATIGGTRVPRGSYSLYSVPSAASLTLIVSKKPGGNPPDYDKSQDLARITMESEQTPSLIDPLTISLVPEGEGAATLSLGWADRRFSTRMVILN